jgi:hypothetical protein
MILYHATSTAVPEEDDITGFAEDYPVDYANDGILSNFFSIASLTSVASAIFDMDVGIDPDLPSSEEALEIVEQSLSEVYAGVIVLAALYEVDFGEVLQTASNRSEWK